MARFGGITFLGACLLFLVQPLFARELLPWFGGAQSVWTTCLVCFQVLLLGGYLYSHLGRRVGIRRQAVLHGVLLLLSLASLPIAVSPNWKPTGVESPTWWLVGLLATTVGGPYLLLATTAPLLHDWFGRQRPDRSPYPLYAVSNVGSLLALLAYPTLVEPLFTVSRQAALWSAAYVGFVIACAWLSLGVARGGADASPTTRTEDDRWVSAPSRHEVGLWLALSACCSGLLVALTNHITLDVAVVPFLWVLPLSLYLLTFVFAFAGLYRRSLWGPLLVLALGAMAILWNWGFALPFAVQIVGSAVVLFTGCMVCHGELARSAPGAPYLTAFYLTMAAGGGLGGLLVALVAPTVFPDFWELPGFLLLAYALLLVVVHRDRAPTRRGASRTLRWAVFASILIVATAGFVLPTLRRDRGTVATARNFYGVLRVQDAPAGMLDNQRVLRVGRIFHGGQFLDPARTLEATSYFTAGSGVEMAIRRHPRRLAGQTLKLGVIGLGGVGTLAAWGERGDSVRFYEINPAVATFARSYFSFLDDSEAAVTVVLGDGRLSLEREVADPENHRRFDVLVVDAFSGDAVPVHLLTRESADLYQSALAPDGVLVFQVTNRHLDLARVVRGIAAAKNLEAVQISFDPTEGSGGTPNSWILATRNEELLERVRPDATPPGSEPAVLWTDDHSNLFGILR